MLLTRCLDDVADEVRDRAALALRSFLFDEEEATNYIAPKTQYSLPNWSRNLLFTFLVIRHNFLRRLTSTLSEIHGRAG